MITENSIIIDEIPIGHLIECAHSSGVVELFIKYDENNFYWLEVYTKDTWKDASVTELTISSMLWEGTIVTDHGFAEDEKPGEIRKKLENEKHIK